MAQNRRIDLTHDLVLPTLLFTALGGMTWAVRGCSGFGASAGCVFAGVTWGAAWWYIAHDPRREQSRRYASGWIVLAMTLGIGLSGAQGWMQWPSFFRGELMTDASKNQFVPISPRYGFLWLFLAGMPWAGVGAALLTWTGSLRATRWWHWLIRIACGVGFAHVAWILYDSHHEWFLPLYDSLGPRYEAADRGATDPSLARLVNDCGEAMTHLGLYLGLLIYETGCAVYRLARRELADWKNPVLILTVGVLNGVGWALCQNWQWASGVFGKEAHFNFWRCWESSGGLTIGVAYGIAYFLVNRRMSDQERAIVASRQSVEGPNFEWLLVFLGLAYYADIAPLSIPATRIQMGGWIPPVFSKWATEIPGQWSTLYFTVILLFAGLYYLLRRPPAPAAGPKNSGLLRAGDSIVGALLATLLAASLFVPSHLFVQRVIKLGLSNAALFYNRSLRRLGEAPRIGKFFTSMQIDRFGLLYIEIFAGFLLVLGLVWFLLSRHRLEAERKIDATADGDPNLERLGLYLGLLMGLGLSICNGLKGWFNIYCLKDNQFWTGFFERRFGAKGNEDYWLQHLWYGLGPTYLLLLIAATVLILVRPMSRTARVDVHPHAYGWMWLVLIVQNVIAQLITGPPNDWYEMAFSIYYLLLFFITAVIVVHFRFLKQMSAIQPSQNLPVNRGNP